MVRGARSRAGRGSNALGFVGRRRGERDGVTSPHTGGCQRQAYIPRANNSDVHTEPSLVDGAAGAPGGVGSANTRFTAPKWSVVENTLAVFCLLALSGASGARCVRHL